jgi:N-methylhydantoinase A
VERPGAAETTPITGRTVLIGADMQFRGQTHLLRVELPAAALMAGELGAATLRELFAAAYFRRFAVRLPEIGAVLVNLHTTVIGRRPDLAPETLIAGFAPAPSLEDARIGTRPVWFAAGFMPTPVYDRACLPLRHAFTGPAIVQQVDATTVIEPSDAVRVDRLGNLVIEVTALASGR